MAETIAALVVIGVIAAAPHVVNQILKLREIKERRA